jgi:hypothetical protein
MTKGLIRYQQAGGMHFITFSCYHRLPYLSTRRVAHPSVLLRTHPSQDTEGAPSFAYFAKGGIHNNPLSDNLIASRRWAVHSDSISTVPILPVA